MELPFAVVESPNQSTTLNQSTASSLVTASSQGSSVGSLPSGGGGGLGHGIPAYNPSPPFQQQQHVYTHPKATPPQQKQPSPTTEAIDFTYVTVCEEDADEVDVVIDGGEVLGPTANTAHQQQQQQRGDVLTLLLSGQSTTREAKSMAFVDSCEAATGAAQDALTAKDKGYMQQALDAHSKAAKLFRTAATEIRERNASLANSLLLLSKAQAASALALKRTLKLRPTTTSQQESESHKDRLLATVRGALVTKNEADISDSAFLGRATSDGPRNEENHESNKSSNDKETETDGSVVPDAASTGDAMNTNPVDDMMELEKELRDMDMALELGNSIASLGSRATGGGRMKHSMMDGEGSFCVVPPGASSSASYMSSSTMWTAAASNNNVVGGAATTSGGTAGVRARANRVQTVAPTRAATPVAPPPPPLTFSHAGTLSPPQAINKPSQQTHPSPGLESSWWGHTSTTMTPSQALASSIMSTSRDVYHSPSSQQQPQQPVADTKQLMRFLDSLKTLGDENAALLREVEEAEAARAEARAAREQMKRFKADYGKRFEALKAALEKFRKGYPDQQDKKNNKSNPVSNSDYIRTSVSEEMQKKDQLIRKLRADLKKEMDESKKKDAALRKYESFYREVKARSAQKAAQRQKEAQTQKQQLGQQRQRSKVSAAVPPRVPR